MMVRQFPCLATEVRDNLPIANICGLTISPPQVSSDGLYAANPHDVKQTSRFHLQFLLLNPGDYIYLDMWITTNADSGVNKPGMERCGRDMTKLKTVNETCNNSVLLPYKTNHHCHSRRCNSLSFTLDTLFCSTRGGFSISQATCPSLRYSRPSLT